MAPVVWGLDLKEMQWYKFKSSYMFKNRDYHLRRTKFIVYQLALIFCVVSESLGTAALSDYIDEQKFVHRLNPNAYVYNNDYVGAASYNIFAGVFVATIFGAAFFFDLFWPERHESKSVRTAWKVCGILAVIFHLAAALELTVITAMHQGHVTGVSEQEGANLVGQFHKDDGTPLNYKKNPRALAAVVFVWLGFASIVPSCMLLFLSIDNTETGPGPKTAHAQDREAAHIAANSSSAEREAQSFETEKERSSQEPEPTHQQSREQATAQGETPYATPAAEIPANTAR
ncbi:hypothetical protein LTR36_000495 [Oleoguttula mirabilis]|uniref:Uncharacterized protein n=1 Tax=Oleoguttula mirabilis TaxID=1507867 RepID=A0AAV9JQ43_9PEZI|nr:hypothetical protein LTR36_000495 [Oleoguttula mirabilis]